GGGRARRRAGGGAQRQARPVLEEGLRLAVAGVRGGAVHGHDRAGQGAVRAAEAARQGPGRGGAAARAGRGPELEETGGGQGGPVRPVRDGRRDQRVAAQGRHGG